jgi:hypothetical protein
MSGAVPHLLLYARMELTRTILCLLYFLVIPRRLNFICRRFGTLCSVFVDVVYTIKFRSREITQKKEYNIQNTAKVLNQEFYIYMLYLHEYVWGIRRMSAAARLPRSWVRIPPGGMDICLL